MLRLPIILAALMTLLAVGACTTANRPHDAAARFKTAVAAPNKHYTLYWLGTEFEAAGVTYRGPFAPGLGDVTDPDALTLSYPADTSAHGDGVKIQIASRSVVKIPADYGVPRAVRVGTHDATLYTGKLNGGGENLSIVVRFGDTVVFARTGYTVGPNGADLNPLTDADTFLAVMQDLRPYPQ